MTPSGPALEAHLVSWPMYAIDDAVVRSFWNDLRSALRAAQLPAVPSDLGRPVDLMAHWCDPALLLSQTCGYPFVTGLRGKVRYVCTPCFRAPGCVGASYCSAVVVREADPANALDDLRGGRAAYNSRDSQSGYNALRFLAAPHARAGRFFERTVETGSHRASLAAVRNGDADVAAIDVVTLALVQAAAPQEAGGLRVLAYSPATPGLPLVTSLRTSDDQLSQLRQACAVACEGSRHPGLLLDGIAVLDAGAYDAITEMERHARELGYPELA